MGDNKIYIIGPVGSGKTTLSRLLSEKYSIESYELDKIVWDDDNGNIKRTDEEIAKMFNEIISKDSWMIEDVGRKKDRRRRTEDVPFASFVISPWSFVLRTT